MLGKHSILRKLIIKETKQKLDKPQWFGKRGDLHIDYLGKGKTITGSYYLDLLERLDVDLKLKPSQKVLFNQNIAPAHTCVFTMAKIHKLSYELLPHSACSPDLDPLD